MVTKGPGPQVRTCTFRRRDLFGFPLQIVLLEACSIHTFLAITVFAVSIRWQVPVFHVACVQSINSQFSSKRVTSGARESSIVLESLTAEVCNPGAPVCLQILNVLCRWWKPVRLELLKGPKVMRRNCWTSSRATCSKLCWVTSLNPTKFCYHGSTSTHTTQAKVSPIQDIQDIKRCNTANASMLPLDMLTVKPVIPSGRF